MSEAGQASAAGLDALDAMLDARLQALERRASANVSFAVGGGSDDPGVDALWQLVEHARGMGDAPASVDVSFDLQGDDQPRPPDGLLARASHELSALVRAVLRDASQQALVETEGRLRTRVGWTGDAWTQVVPGVSAAEVAAHVAAVEAAVTASARRLRIVTLVASTAGKIAVLIAAPQAAVLALPIAYRCVRDVYEQWRALGREPSPGGT